jgi:hypothetical protein
MIDGKNIITELYTLDNKAHVLITPICEALGIRQHGQATRLKADPQFSPTDICAPSNGGNQTYVSLPVEEVGMWLCGINSRKVKEEVRPILLEFKKHCQHELHRAITGEAGTARVEALEHQMQVLTQCFAALTRTVENMSKVAEQQGQTIAMLQQQVHPLVDSEQALASIGGKLMNRARLTKQVRDNLH